MKNQEYILQEYIADDGKVFDWVNLEAHQAIDENNNVIQEHLYAKAIYLGVGDSIENYVEIDDPRVE